MLVANTIVDLRRWRAAADGPVGLVPTMGALHAGHLSLVSAARTRCPTVVVSVFVNPLQFGDAKDLATYPRDLTGDLDELRAAGVDAVFAPDAEAFTDDLATSVKVTGLTDRYEGAFRPGHFAGVTTVVVKLFNAVGPHLAFFGEKDYQQLATIRRMVADLNVPVDVVGLPTVRDGDGLALSSRNVHLTADERTRALRLSQALRGAAAAWSGDADAARAALWGALRDGDGIAVDYAEVVDPDTLEPLSGPGHDAARALVAARVGGTRLIDNLLLAPGEAVDDRGVHAASVEHVDGGCGGATHNGPGNVSRGRSREGRPSAGDRATHDGPIEGA
ncbi:MAG TPA: pantoate--beta-alanine ligase [Euzebyales bacterium]